MQPPFSRADICLDSTACRDRSRQAEEAAQGGIVVAARRDRAKRRPRARRNNARSKAAPYRIPPSPAFRNEGDIEPKLADLGDQIGRCPVDQLRGHTWMCFAEAAQQVAQESGGKRGETDPDASVLGPADCHDIGAGLSDLADDLPCAGRNFSPSAARRRRAGEIATHPYCPRDRGSGG